MKETSPRSPQSPPSSYQSQVAAECRDKVKFRDKGNRSMGATGAVVPLKWAYPSPNTNIHCLYRGSSSDHINHSRLTSCLDNIFRQRRV